MEKKEIVKVFRLLKCYFPNAKQIEDTTLQMAWALALEPYPYTDVKAAVVEHVRKNAFFPDVPDITSLLKVQKEERKANRRAETWKFSMPLYARACGMLGLETWELAQEAGTSWEDWYSRYQEILPQLPESYSDYKRKGLSYSEQCAAVDASWTDFWKAHNPTGTDLGVPY